MKQVILQTERKRSKKSAKISDEFIRWGAGEGDDKRIFFQNNLHI